MSDAPEDKPPAVNVAQIFDDGPLEIRGDMDIEGHAPTLQATFCRCGASKNKPFCDDSHVAIGFQASGEPPTHDSKPLEAEGGKLLVTPRPDGPLVIKGNLTIVSDSGRTLNRVQKVALCRCGHSANKPYCDGTHSKIGFKTS